ncbi:MAG: hypothetical protein NTZ85_05070 [Bacteroidia bacterium]|jgi:hypothetical protein|nr:hypothetical protein [Bacteroidia bacterium]
MGKNIAPIILLISVLLNSCTTPHFYYTPIIQNVPLFNDKNQFSGDLAGSFGTVNNCFEIQTAFSLPGHIALTANYMTGGNDNSSEYYNDFARINYFESSLGYYRSFENIGVFEIYSGYGRGYQRHAFTSWQSWSLESDGRADMSYSKIFIQPDIGIKKGWMEAAFSCRLSRLNFTDIKIDNSVYYHLDELNTLRQNNTPWLIEPAFTFRGGSKSVKGQIQVVFSQNLTNSYLMFERFRFNIGLYISLSKKQSKK